MDQPLVSIVVISYNQGKYIRENLDSIQSQTYDNIQLIVADDASKDDSVEIFDKWLLENNYFAEKNYHLTNTGLATTLNECFELIKGKYVKFIAADDYLHPQSIEKCVRKLEELGDNYGMVFTDTFCVNDNSSIRNDILHFDSLGKIDPETFREELLKANKIAAPTVLMRTRVLKETGEYESNLLIEDYFRWLKISQKYFIAKIPEKLTYYRIHDSNISKLKEEIIAQEEVFLSIIFDKNGYNKDKINFFIKQRYLKKQSIDNKLKDSYISYLYNIKRLAFALKYNVPVVVYNFFNKYIT